MTPRHGTLTAYTHLKCRCPECKEVARVYSRERARKLGGFPKKRKEWQHGTLTGVRHKCKCNACKKAQYDAYLRKKKRAMGTEPPSHGTVRGYGLYGCRCEKCTRAQVASNKRYNERSKQNFVARQKWLNEESVNKASRHGYVWTGPELEIASRSDLPVPQVATMLGRSEYAVRTIRVRLRREPKLKWVAGIRDAPMAEEVIGA